MFKSGHYF